MLARDSLAGWLASLFLHLLFLTLLIAVIRNTPRAPRGLERFIPINVVELGQSAASSTQQIRAAVPQQREETQQPLHHRVPVATAPAGKIAAPDVLAAQLRSLSLLRARADLPVLDDTETSHADPTSDDVASNSEAGYRVRDYIRNQVERRWSLNLNQVRAHAFAIRIRIALKPNGEITKADIIDKARFATDAAYRDVALSARNAVLLSSPIALPGGHLSLPLTMTLQLDPRDTLH